MKSFYRRMAEEKGIIHDDIDVEHNGTMHFMNVEQIIEIIEAAPEHEKAKIKDIFSKIDFKNGDIKHFIKHLATGFIANNY